MRRRTRKGNFARRGGGKKQGDGQSTNSSESVRTPRKLERIHLHKIETGREKKSDLVSFCCDVGEEKFWDPVATAPHSQQAEGWGIT